VSTCHFALFDLQPAFDIDPQRLAERYRELARETHPDRFADAPASEQRRVLERAAQLNDAYQTLKSPSRRAHYLLGLRGESLPLEATVQDPEFLMQQMLLREDLEDLQDSADLDGVAAFKRRLKTAQARLEADFSACWDVPAEREQAERLLVEVETRIGAPVAQRVGRVEGAFVGEQPLQQEVQPVVEQGARVVGVAKQRRGGEDVELARHHAGAPRLFDGPPLGVEFFMEAALQAIDPLRAPQGQGALEEPALPGASGVDPAGPGLLDGGLRHVVAGNPGTPAGCRPPAPCGPASRGCAGG